MIMIGIYGGCGVDGSGQVEKGDCLWGGRVD